MHRKPAWARRDYIWGHLLCIAAILLLLVVPWTQAATLDQWLQSEKSTATQRLVNNILSNGAVIASPSTDNPNYYFHWVRDAALTMNLVVTLYTQSNDPVERQKYWNLLATYLDFSLTNQMTPNPSTAMGRGLGEPKFNTDGSAFTACWGRPQDDGPALRALTFTRLANALLDGADPNQVTLVKTKLYDSKLPTNAIIKRDLEYVSHNWQATCFDLWEEVSGHHFYTRMVQRRALLEGAKLARRLSDPGAADWYTQQANALEQALRTHWDSSAGIIKATLDRDGGLATKSSNLDAAVVLAVLHAQSADDSFFGPADDAVVSTGRQLLSRFQELYPINSVAKSPDGDVLGIAIGRYPEDVYSGNAGMSGGNPWVLCTAALAELCYRAANTWDQGGQLQVTERNKAFLVQLNATRFSSLQVGQALMRGGQGFADVLNELRAAGDRQLARIKYHSFPDGGLSEQMNRTTGFMQSARDLTWNYACILTTLANRPSTPSVTRVLERPVLMGRSPGVPLPAPALVPVTISSLNRGGIPMTLPPAKTRPNVGAARASNAIGSPPSQDLALRIKKLEEAVESLTREVRVLRAGKTGVK
jgi:glucoamylase